MNNELIVRDPYTGDVVGATELFDETRIDGAIARAKGAFAKTKSQPPFERADLLHRIASAIAAAKTELAELIRAEAGKPITLAEAEVDRAVITFTAAAEEARRTHGELLDVDCFSNGAGHFAMMRRFPVGVVLGITPFNFPLNLVAHKVAPAIAAGCPIIVKPSPRTPLTALRLEAIIRECGGIDGQMSVVVCENEHVDQLLHDDRIALISFTGSGDVGWNLRRGAGRKKVVLELGGNAAVIVHEDANLDDAVPAIANGAFAYAGQSCISVQRIFAHAAIYEDFKERLVAQIREKIKVGDTRDRETVVGPMIDDAAAERVRSAIAAARKAGATILAGESSRGTGFQPVSAANDSDAASLSNSESKTRAGSPCHGTMVWPMLIADADPSLDVVAKEIFGPVATLSSYDDFDDALARVNDSRFGLQAGVYTCDLGRIMRAFEALDVGGVIINQPPTFRLDPLPYGGVKESGSGREGVRWAMEEMMEVRTLIARIP